MINETNRAAMALDEKWVATCEWGRREACGKYASTCIVPKQDVAGLHGAVPDEHLEEVLQLRTRYPDAGGWRVYATSSTYQQFVLIDQWKELGDH
jgi:hypothetical protein